MQTAAFVYRPHLPALEKSPRHRETPFSPAHPKALRVLVAGRIEFPVRYLSDRLLRATSRAQALNFQTVLNLLRDLPQIDLIMLDASLPGFGGVEDLRTICDQAGDTPVLVVCGRGEARNAVKYLRGGAAGVIPNDMSGEAITGAIQLILSGQRFAPPDLLMEPADPESRRGELMGSLSTREGEVAQLIAQGCPNKEIACRLGLQEITIKVYASAIFRKLGVRNRTAAAARLLAEGI